MTIETNRERETKIPRNFNGQVHIMKEKSFYSMNFRFGSLHIRIVSDESIRLNTDKKIIQLKSCRKKYIRI